MGLIAVQQAFFTRIEIQKLNLGIITHVQMCYTQVSYVVLSQRSLAGYWIAYMGIKHNNITQKQREIVEYQCSVFYVLDTYFSISKKKIYDHKQLEGTQRILSDVCTYGKYRKYLVLKNSTLYTYIHDSTVCRLHHTLW